MSRLFSTALGAVLAFGLASTSWAAPALTGLTVDGSATAEGTVGATLTITGSELGTKPPKAVLQLHGDSSAKPIALKLAKPFDGSTLHASITKITPGVYDLVVTVKGGDPVTLDSAFTARAPHIDSLSLSTFAPGDKIDILGRFFGASKGKVTIGDVAAKVFGKWADGKITVVVSKKNTSGSATIDVFGKGGTQDDGATATVVAPISGKDNLTVTFDNGGGKLVFDDPTATIFANTYKVTAGKPSGLTFNLFDIQGITMTTGAPSNGPVIVDYTGALKLAPFVYLNSGTWTTTLDNHVGNRISGSFSGTLTRQSGSKAGTYDVTGTFTATLK